MSAPAQAQKAASQVPSSKPAAAKEKKETVMYNPFLESAPQKAPEQKAGKDGKDESKKEQYAVAKKRLTTLQQFNLEKFGIIPGRSLQWIGPAKMVQDLQPYRDEVVKFASTVDVSTVKHALKNTVMNGLLGLKGLAEGDTNLDPKLSSGVQSLVARYVPFSPADTKIWSQEAGKFVPLASLFPQVPHGLGNMYLTGQLRQIQKSLRGQEAPPDKNLIL
jgi:hypothetical protein